MEVLPGLTNSTPSRSSSVFAWVWPDKKALPGAGVGRSSGLARQVAVGEVQDVPVGLDEGVVGHAREVEHHLVNFGIAVAAHGNDALRQAVEQRDRLFRRVAFRQVVARAVVQQVAQQDGAVGRFGFDAVDERAHGERRVWSRMR